jgi:hypothetical protein
MFAFSNEWNKATPDGQARACQQCVEAGALSIRPVTTIPVRTAIALNQTRRAISQRLTSLTLCKIAFGDGSLTMNWEAAGAIGEIIGALAVFLTLVYLAVQIRQNTKAVQASAVDASIKQVTGVRQSLYENAEIAEIYVKGMADPHDLDEVSQTRFRVLLHNIFLSISNVYSQTNFAGLDTSEWESQLVVLKRVLAAPGARWFWHEYKLEFDEKFREQVDNLLQDT